MMNRENSSGDISIQINMFNTPSKQDTSFNTPSKRNVSGAYNSSAKTRMKGLFQDGRWHCNCRPNLPASHFEVRKKGPNKGRWFYTCKNSRESGCGFFLWSEDAAPRMMNAAIGNSRSEPGDETKVLAERGSPRMTVEGHVEASNKWMNESVRTEKDDFDLSSGEEDEVAAVLNEAEKTLSIYPETPRKTVKTEQEATPGSKRKWANVMPTPNTVGNADDVFSTPNSRLQRGIFDGNENRRHLLSPSATPTPSRFRDASEPGELSKNSDYDITEDVLGLLKGQPIEKDTITALTQMLNRHALRTRGVVKGRDITRVALKARDTKIVELQEKIKALETERDMDKVVIQHFKNDMADGIKRRERGRGRGT